MKNKSQYSLVFVAAAAAMAATSTSLRALEGGSGEIYTIKQTIKSTEGTDEQTEYLFTKTYVYTTYLKNDAVSADVKDGVVTLIGTVADESHKRLAQETAANLPKVIRVDNRLTTNAEVADENADARMNRKVKLALLFHRTVNSDKTIVDVKNGLVTLRGEAASTAQKELTTDYARDIEGVKKVKNKMTVASAPKPAEWTAGEKVDDASVTAQVKQALLTHRSTSSSQVTVETRDGKVTLTGIAKNATEKSQATKLITDIHGVTSVKNEMTVEKSKANWFEGLLSTRMHLRE